MNDDERRLVELRTALSRFLQNSTNWQKPVLLTQSLMFAKIGDPTSKSDAQYYARILKKLTAAGILGMRRSETNHAWCYIIADPQRMESLLSSDVSLAQVLDRGFSPNGSLPLGDEPSAPEPTEHTAAPESESATSSELTEAVVSMARHFGALVDTVSQLRSEVATLRQELDAKTTALLRYWEPKTPTPTPPTEGTVSGN